MSLSYHSMLLLNDGTVKATGSNANGQLGIGNTANQNSPVTVPVTNVKSLWDSMLLEVIAIYISSSNDGVAYTSYEPIKADDLPQARYLKFKAVLNADVQQGKTNSFVFDQTKPETKVLLNEFLEKNGTAIKPKTLYIEPLSLDSTYSDGKLFKVTVDRSLYKKINKLEVK